MNSHSDVVRYVMSAWKINKDDKELGSGTYNIVYKAYYRPYLGKQGEMALRVSYKEEQISLLQDELKIYKTFSQNGLALPLLNVAIIGNRNHVGYGWMAMLTPVAYGSLESALKQNPAKYNTISDDFIHQLCNIIVRAAEMGYICIDINTANILVYKNLPYITDLDPTFCEKGSHHFLQKFCVKHNIVDEKCLFDPETLPTLKLLYSRMMMFQLCKYVHSVHPSCKEFHSRLLSASVKMVKEAFPGHVVPLTVQGRTVRTLDLIRNVVGNDENWYVQVLRHYFKKDGMIYRDEFKTAIGSIYDIDTMATRHSIKNQTTSSSSSAHAPASILSSKTNSDIFISSRSKKNSPMKDLKDLKEIRKSDEDEDLDLDLDLRIKKSPKNVSDSDPPSDTTVKGMDKRILPSRGKKARIGEECVTNNDCYTRTCRDLRCVRAEKKVRKSPLPVKVKLQKNPKIPKKKLQTSPIPVLIRIDEPKKRRAPSKKRTIGEPCTSDQQCYTNHCVNDLCEPNQKKKPKQPIHNTPFFSLTVLYK